MELAARLEDRERSRALFCWNINIAASNPEQARLHAALAREDLFTVVVDLFATDTSDFADIVLPAASFLECDDLVASYFHLSLGAQVKAIEPLGESLPNSEIFRRLAAAMGFEEPELYESDAEVIANVLRPPAAASPSWPPAGRCGSIRSRVVQFADLRFPTPERADRDRQRGGRGRRAPARARSRTPTRDPRTVACGCSRRRRRGCSTTASPTTRS